MRYVTLEKFTELTQNKIYDISSTDMYGVNFSMQEISINVDLDSYEIIFYRPGQNMEVSVFYGETVISLGVGEEGIVLEGNGIADIAMVEMPAQEVVNV